ncbi:hypothetical protein FCE95_13885 [Luteimonas gilva]|uniref:Uncharacterized protein n=1 Tax=Luteimonas gilva TaxID=2572684 RepID=A0A4U5JL67_9GAMM|nr:hypothetical protein [Luteimonas gilva]TKR29251.1 hypothetical protein FCE95_13885 [Luteimonas gilva]
METDKVEQIEAFLSGDPYRWAVSKGLIRDGDPLHTRKTFSITRRDVVAYLETHPVPGFDVRRDAYRDSRDGPKIQVENGIYRIGWQERGMFSPERSATDEATARRYWIEFLAASFGLPA